MIAVWPRSLHRELLIRWRPSHRINEEDNPLSEMRNQILAAWAIAIVLVAGLGALTFAPLGPRSAIVGAVDVAVHGFKVEIPELDRRGIEPDFVPDDSIEASGDDIVAPMVLSEPMAHTRAGPANGQQQVTPWEDHCVATGWLHGAG